MSGDRQGADDDREQSPMKIEYRFDTEKRGDVIWVTCRASIEHNGMRVTGESYGDIPMFTEHKWNAPRWTPKELADQAYEDAKRKLDAYADMREALRNRPL